MNIHSISFKILGVFFTTFILTAIIVIILAQIQLTSTINSSQKDIYEEKINTILNILLQKEERLDATSLRNAYIDAFQESTLETIENTYYNSQDIKNQPLIIDGDGQILLSPLTLKKDFEDSADLHEFWKQDFFEFNFISLTGIEYWCIFRTFPNWDWTVCYVIPLKEKYADSRNLRNMLILFMIIVVIIVLSVLSIIIKGMIKPISILTSMSKAMAEGDLNQNIDIDGKDEIGSLARNFDTMGKVIRDKINEQELRIIRTKKFQDSVFSLAVSEPLPYSSFRESAKKITETIAHALDCERASIWIFSEDQSTVNCIDLYERSKLSHTLKSDMTISVIPSYFELILSHSSLSIDDVYHDSRSRVLTDEYLIRNNISSIIDTAIYVSGKIVGLVCIEEVSHIRKWEVDEIAYAGTIAEHTAQALINSQKATKEKELRQLQDLLENIINSMPSAIVGVNNDKKVVQWNSEAENITGIKKSDALGRDLINLFILFENKADEILSAIDEGIVQKIRRIPFRINGENHYFDITVFPLNKDLHEVTIIRFDDITEKLKMDEMMVQSEKMLSVGGLAAGMAHEINNPLAGLMQTANVIANRLWLKVDNSASQKAAEKTGIDLENLKEFMSEREIPRMIQKMNESGRRVAELVQNMLSFARKSESLFSSHDIVYLLEKTLELASTDFDIRKHYDFKTIEIKREFENNLPMVSCDTGKIQQVILNLLHNGQQAMNASETDNPQFIIRAYLDVSKKMICIEIEDNGPGMEEHVRKRVFEPFFTTKPEGIGTGLGLSVSYFIITENHKGEMEVVSSPGKGSNFIFRLPIIE